MTELSPRRLKPPAVLPRPAAPSAAQFGPRRAACRKAAAPLNPPPPPAVQCGPQDSLSCCGANEFCFNNDRWGGFHV